MIDRLYAGVANRKPFFSQGWGRPELIDYLLTSSAQKLNRNQQRPKIHDIRWTEAVAVPGGTAREGFFESPFQYTWQNGRRRELDQLPEGTRTARFLWLEPNDADADTPLALHYAATGDEGYGRRRTMIAGPLLKQKIGALILENPLYGSRRPQQQATSNSERVIDLLQMSRAAQEEGIALLDWFRGRGRRCLGVTGVSMGGYMALAVAARYRRPLAVAACIPSHSATPVYSEGILARKVDWERLGRDYPHEDPRRKLIDVLDLSDLRHLPPVAAPEACLILGGRRDQYIPAYSTNICHQHNAGSEQRWLDYGHVTAFILGRHDFQSAVEESFTRWADLRG